ncbi:MAG TPA: hypothetical protein VF180_05110 [Acidimicrobiia bacterium]
MGKSAATSLVLSAVFALTGANCGNLLGGPPFSEKEADSVLSYILVDYSIGGDAQAEGPRVLAKVANAGSQYHELEVIDGEGKRLGRVPPFPVGMTLKPLYLELKPGTYTLRCNVTNPDGKVHRDLGMNTKLVVK